MFNLGSRLTQAIHDPSGGNGIIAGKMYQLLLEIVEGVTRPEYRSCHEFHALRAASTAAVNSAKATSFETR
ncbi:hypothetical protein GCM10011529_31110 [Polymorphobacter glacialis]|uniref:Uncharacterized protein n=1 Tax=Sandarakinorhabdus glacialis TaxID=1614636 RepID=A0A917ECH1_9SPHN|nr:hypothetical protein GCM10011529_31110 [Polymorphobacter glacialis]